MPDSMKGSDILIQPGQDPSDNGKKPIEKEAGTKPPLKWKQPMKFWNEIS
jgi:hypothetical protein